MAATFQDEEEGCSASAAESGREAAPSSAQHSAGQHTPGPWTIEDLLANQPGSARAAEDAAPDLLGALKFALPLLEEAREALCGQDDVCVFEGEDGLTLAIDAARAALAKAQSNG